MGDTRIVIPVSMASSRLDNKPMLMTGGKPLLHWTFDQASKVSDWVWIATDNDEVIKYCEQEGIPFIVTSPNHQCGTTRVAEACLNLKFSDSDVVVNWQVDEPLVEPSDVAKLCKSVSEESGFVHEVHTLVSPIDREQAENEDTVKVIVNGQDECVWFSRALMFGSMGHCGIYAADSTSFIKIARQNACRFSVLEKLEQLTWLYHGLVVMKAVKINELPMSINNEEDWSHFVTLKEL